MMPVGPLMKEHRLIERMITVMNSNVENIKKQNEVDPSFIDKAVDFIRTYADKCHHGKEEDILFRALEKKDISAEHRRIMDELIKEHVIGRNNVKKLVEAKEKYLSSGTEFLKDVVSNTETLIEFYPKHIEKEDKHFFLPCMDYFTKQEQDNMLREMQEFDRNMIHEIYTKVVEGCEKINQEGK